MKFCDKLKIAIYPYFKLKESTIVKSGDILVRPNGTRDVIFFSPHQSSMQNVPVSLWLADCKRGTKILRAR